MTNPTSRKERGKWGTRRIPLLLKGLIFTGCGEGSRNEHWCYDGTIDFLLTMITKVREWLETQGFSLEMRTASAFRTAGFQVRQSSYYVDSETGKAREIDVLAIHPDIYGVIDIQFIVECKSSSKPWVLICSPHTLVGYNRLFALAALSRTARHALSDRESLTRLGKLPWYRKEGLIGYSLRQAFSDVDIAYAAAIGTTKACADFVGKTKGSRESLAFAFPVVVIDGPLIRCFLAENGDVQLEEVEEGEFLFSGHELGACIRVVTAARLSAFALEAKSVADELRAGLKSEEERVVEGWKNLKNV